MGLTTVTLAKKVRLSQAQVSRLEIGLQGFRSATLIRFARVLGVPPSYFFVAGEDASAGRVAKEMETLGLAPSPSTTAMTVSAVMSIDTSFLPTTSRKLAKSLTLIFMQ
jgi:transcriptional regulator with XRE-family HTH domain